MSVVRFKAFLGRPGELRPELVARLKASRWPDPVTGCWCWVGPVNGGGYGVMPMLSRMRLVHRLAYSHWHGPIPAGLDLMHSCDNPQCFNPDHLAVGTRADNMADASCKGRLAKKLSRSQVAEIAASRLSVRVLARRFGVAAATIRYHRRRFHSPPISPVQLSLLVQSGFARPSVSQGARKVSP